MKSGLLLLMIVLASVFSCSHPQNETNKEGFYLPHGDPVAGRQAFSEMMCYKCHQVKGDQFAPPVATPPVSVVLGPHLKSQTSEALAESIIAPSHKIPKEMKNAFSGNLSRMGDYSHAMTVQQLIDIVAYLKELKENKAQ